VKSPRPPFHTPGHLFKHTRRQEEREMGVPLKAEYLARLTTRRRRNKAAKLSRAINYRRAKR
jgi:hypothetical protein